MTEATELVRTRGAAAFAMRQLARRLGCEPAALYHYARSKDEVLAAVATEVGDSVMDSVLARTSAEESAQRSLEIGLATLLQLADQEPHVWELLFLDRRVAAVGCRIRLRLQDHLASLIARRVVETHHMWRVESARAASVVLTVAIGEASLRVCRPNLLECKVSASQIIGLIAQPLET